MTAVWGGGTLGRMGRGRISHSAKGGGDIGAVYSRHICRDAPHEKGSMEVRRTAGRKRKTGTQSSTNADLVRTLT